MNDKRSGLAQQLLFYCAKQPGIYGLMISGILLDFMIQFPFIVICTLENFFRDKGQFKYGRSYFAKSKKNSGRPRTAASIIRPGTEI